MLYINILIAFTITKLYGITNTVIMTSLIHEDIIIEIIIFMGFMFTKALFYNYFFSEESSLSKLFIN